MLFVINICFFVCVGAVLLSQVGILILKVEMFFDQKDSHTLQMQAQKERFEKIEQSQEKIVKLLERMETRVIDLNNEVKKQNGAQDKKT